MIVLNAKEVHELLDMPTAVEAAKQALRLHSRGAADVPLRVNLPVAEHGGQALFMPAYVRGADALAVKIVSVYPGNVDRGLPSVPADVVLLDPTTGQVCALIEGTSLTQIRTGAVQGAGTDALARADARTGALIGAGGQAMAQLEAMLCVRPLTTVAVHDRDTARARGFIEQAQVALGRYGARLVIAASAAEAAAGADVVTVVTTATESVLRAADVAPGTHVNGVGSYTPAMQELASDLVAAADVVVCDTPAALAEAGSLIRPIEQKLLDRDSVLELGAVLDGHVHGRTSADQITVFDTVGSAVLDAVAAHRVYEAALATGAGVHVDL